MRPCPECGAEIRKEIKSWDATPKAYPSHIKVTITIWKCLYCGHKYRTAERTWKNPMDEIPQGRGSTFRP